MSKRTETTMPTLGDHQDVQIQVVTGLHKIGMAIRHASWAGGEILGLTPSQGQILQILRARVGQDTRLDDIARELAVTPATASVAVKVLVEKGMVVRQRSVTDGRAISLGLTDQGSDAARQTAGWTEFLAEAVGTLEPDEQAIFQRSIVKMIRTMQERGQIPISRMCANCQFFRPHVHETGDRPHHCMFVDAAFGDRELRLDCGDFQIADDGERDQHWRDFVRPNVRAD